MVMEQRKNSETMLNMEAELDGRQVRGRVRVRVRLRDQATTLVLCLVGWVCRFSWESHAKPRARARVRVESRNLTLTLRSSHG